jgi:hypothetical protein
MKPLKKDANKGEVARNIPARSAPVSPSHLRRNNGSKTTKNPHPAATIHSEKYPAPQKIRDS